MPIDYTKYPPNWKTEIRPKILKRAGHKCEHCGLPNYIMVNGITRKPCSVKNQNAIQIILTVAHLDHDEDNWNVKDDRLSALCQKCHFDWDKEDNKNRREENKSFECKRCGEFIRTEGYCGECGINLARGSAEF